MKTICIFTLFVIGMAMAQETCDEGTDNKFCGSVTEKECWTSFAKQGCPCACAKLGNPDDASRTICPEGNEDTASCQSKLDQFLRNPEWCYTRACPCTCADVENQTGHKSLI